MSKKAKMRVVPMMHRIVMDRFSSMNDFKDFLKNAIQNEHQLLSKRIERASKAYTSEEIEALDDMFADDHYMIEDVFTRLSLNAFVVILYSHIEEGLNNLCDAVRQDGKIKLRYTSMKGKGITRAKSYLEKVIGMNLHIAGNDKNTAHWNEIIGLNKIRNGIVHEDAWADDKVRNDTCIKANEQKGLLELEKRRTGIYGKIILKPEYIDWIVPQAYNFFRNLEL